MRELRIMLDAIDIGVITFGVLSNRKFCAEDITDSVFSKFDKKRVGKHVEFFCMNKNGGQTSDKQSLQT